MDGTIFNLQCKNNLVDLSKIEADPKLFARYNRTLDRRYAAALTKEENREHLLKKQLGISNVLHFVVSKFPVATSNPRIISFNQIADFKRLSKK